MLSRKTARELGVNDGDVVRLELGGRALEIAAMVLPGQADYSVGLALGYGRTECGRVGRGIGFNAYLLRTTAAPDIALGARITKTGRQSDPGLQRRIISRWKGATSSGSNARGRGCARRRRAS